MRDGGPDRRPSRSLESVPIVGMGCRTGGASFTIVCGCSAGSDDPGFSLTASSKSQSTKDASHSSGPMTAEH